MTIITVNSVATFMAALASVQGGDTISLAPGTYSGLSLQNFNFSAPVTITSSDPNAQATLTTFKLSNSSGLVFSQLDFDASASPDPYYAFRISSVQNVAFDSLSVHGAIGADPNTAITAFLLRDSSNISVTNSKFSYLLSGINEINNNGVNIVGNNFSKLAGDGIDNSGSNNVTITNNFLTSTVASTNGIHQDFIQFYTYGTTASAHDITISGNTYVRGDGVAIQGIFMNDEVGTLPYLNVTISNNSISGGLYHGITMYNALNPLVSGNTVQGYTGQESWIGLFDVNGAQLSNNMATKYAFSNASNLSETNDKVLSYIDAPTAVYYYPNTTTVTQVTASPAAPGSLALDATTNSGSTADTVTNISQVRIGGTADAGSTVTLFDGTQAIGSTTADSTGHFSVLANRGLSDGIHGLYATASNSVGVSALSAQLAVTIDTQAASSTIKHGQLVSGASAILQGTATESMPSVAYSVSVLQDGISIGSASPVNGSWSYAVNNLTSAVHKYTTQTVDAAGNVGNNSQTLILGTSGRDNIKAGNTSNIIVGGAGADTLAGGSMDDTFVFNSTSDAPYLMRKNAAVETITNFTDGLDHIDLTKLGHFASFDQTSTVSSHSLNVYYSGGNTFITGDTTGDSTPDFLIKLSGLHAISTSDLILV